MLSVIDPAHFEPSAVLVDAYRRAINRAQDGKPDNYLKQMRYQVMAQLATFSTQMHPGLAMVECGCWQGHSTLMLGEIAKIAGASLHVFDSFEGLSEFTDKDISPHFADKKKRREQKTKYATDVARLAGLTKDMPVTLHKGWIPDVFKEFTGEPVCFANIDVNLHAPTRDSLAFVYPLLVKGGAVFLDDYGYKTWPGAQLAVQDYVRSLDEAPSYFVANPFGSAFIIK